MFRSETISQAMVRHSNRPAGFDYLRLVLSTLVVLSHTSNTLYGIDATLNLWSGPLRIPLSMLMPMFFSLSGFLVAGSLERCKTFISFVGLRVVRLIPALTVDTLIAAMVIGPIFTNLTMKEYFTDPLLIRYGLNILGDPQYILPGVFEQNPIPRLINGQLWTLPSELKCYIILTLLALFRITSARVFFAIVSVAVTCAFSIWEAYHPGGANGHLLIECFLFGVTIFLFRDKIPLSITMFVASIALVVLLYSIPAARPLTAIPSVYLTTYLGMLNPKRTVIVSSGDYSYGIFLYGMPIQASVTATFGQIPWPIHFLVSYVIIIGFAMMSWWLVEKPALKVRPYLYALERRLTDTILRIPLGVHLVQPPVGPRLQRPPART